MTVLGQWMIVLAVAASGVSAIANVGKALGRHTFRPSFFAALSALCVALASALLLTLILKHDFSNGYVFSYSDRSLPLGYLISSFYAGQEGSFLFWALCSAIISLALMRSAQRRNVEPWVMAVFMIVQTGMLILVLAKSPFRSVWDMFPQAPAGIVPVDGRGLNPLLQNIWMVIHPPVLFLGFAAMAVPFSLAMAGLWKNDASMLIRQGFPWVLFAAAVLGAGIMMGGYWAYGVLGWGGYWGWDPVENSSLVPWLTAVALLHTMLAQLRTGKFVRANLALALVTFLLVVYSTFLTRSGILGDASVHAFTDPGTVVFWLLLGFLAVMAVSTSAMMAVRWKAMAPQTHDTMLLTRESALGAGMLLLVLMAAVVLFGTSLPIFSNTRVEGSFYDMMNLPVAIAMAVLIGLSLHTQWESQDPGELFRRALRGGTVSIVSGIVLVLAGVHDLPFLFLATASVFALAVNIEIAVRVAKGDWRFLGGKIAHAGIALFFLGVIAPGRYSSSERLVLPLHQPREALGRTFTFLGSVARPDGKTGFTIAIDRGGDARIRMEPVMFDAGQQGIMKNPDIASFLTRDIYVSPLGFDPESSGHESYTVEKGRSVEVGGARVLFVGFDMTGGHGGGAAPPSVGSVLEITRGGGAAETITPFSVMGRGPDGSVHSSVLNAGVQLVAMNIGETSTVTLEVDGPPGAARPATVVVEASVKPFVGLLWAGTLVMLAGFVLAAVKRTKEGGRSWK